MTSKGKYDLHCVDIFFQVYSFFAQDSEDTHLSSKLQTTLKRIRDNLILNPEDGAPGVNSSSVIAVQVQDERKMVEVRG